MYISSDIVALLYPDVLQYPFFFISGVHTHTMNESSLFEFDLSLCTHQDILYFSTCGLTVDR